MPRKAITAMALVLLIGGAAVAGAGKLPFLTDYDAGLKEAKQTGKPAFVYFSADW